MADEIITFEVPSVERLQKTLNWATQLRHDPNQTTLTYQLADTIIELAAYAMAVELEMIEKCGVELGDDRVAPAAA